MKRFTVFTAALAIAATACSSKEATSGTTSSSSSSSSSGSGGAAGAAGAGGMGGAAPIIDPSLFDCSAKKAPVRVNPIPTSCAMDPTCAARLVSGHRGAGGELGVIAPEDSVAAVRAAIVLGIDFVETDPRPTKDGVIVNMHDATVDRTTDGTGTVDQMTYAEIAALHIVSPDTPGDYSCERVPTLAEILTAAKGKVHVLVDANKTNDVAGLVGAIHQADAVEWAIFDTEYEGRIDAALALEPNLRTMIRVTSTADLDGKLAHFAAHPPVIVEVESGSDVKALVPAIHAAKNRAMIDVFVSDAAAGFSGDPSLYDQYVNEGFDILQTERPDLVLQNLGRWPPPPQP